MVLCLGQTEYWRALNAHAAASAAASAAAAPAAPAVASVAPVAHGAAPKHKHAHQSAGAGLLRPRHLRGLFDVLGLSLTRREMKEVLRQLDRNGDGAVDLTDFVTLLSRPARGPVSEEATVSRPFAALDCDGDGLISSDDLIGLAARIGAKLSGAANEFETTKLMRAALGEEQTKKGQQHQAAAAAEAAAAAALPSFSRLTSSTPQAQQEEEEQAAWLVAGAAGVGTRAARVGLDRALFARIAAGATDARRLSALRAPPALAKVRAAGRRAGRKSVDLARRIRGLRERDARRLSLEVELDSPPSPSHARASPLGSPFASPGNSPAGSRRGSLTGGGGGGGGDDSDTAEQRAEDEKTIQAVIGEQPRSAPAACLRLAPSTSTHCASSSALSRRHLRCAPRLPHHRLLSLSLLLVVLIRALPQASGAANWHSSHTGSLHCREQHQQQYQQRQAAGHSGQHSQQPEQRIAHGA